MEYGSAAKYWFDQLGNYSESDFLKKPANDGWCIGQVYIHLILGSDHFFAANSAACQDGKGEIKRGGKNQYGTLIFFLKRFPPMKFKLPKSGVQPRDPENIEYARNKLTKTIEKIQQSAASLNGFDPKMKIKHPGFGYLNAEEWLQLNEFHFQHHMRQKNQLDKFLKS